MRKKLGLAALLVVCAFATEATAGPKKGAKKHGRKAIATKTTAAPATILATKVTAPTVAAATEAAAPAAAPATATASASLLPVTCSSTSAKDPRCGRPMWGSGGTLGAGMAIHGSLGFPKTGEGFVDGNRLVVAVEMGSQFDDQGVIMGVDLKTGDRTILSGKADDVAKGPVTVGIGPNLGNVRAVTQGGASWYALVATGTQAPVSIIRIDPKTGARTLQQKFDKALISSCNGSTAKLYVEFTSGIAAAADGTTYVAVGNANRQVGIVALKGSTCNVVTMSGASGFETKGGGPTIDGLDRYRSLKLDGGKLWALHAMSNSLMTIDIATGNRARVSSAETATKVGSGDAKVGYQTLATAGSKVWTSGGWVRGGFALTEVSATNGQRTAHEGKTGPASFSDDITGLWVHPTKPLLIFAMDNAFGLFDPATGNSALFSE